MTEFGEVYSRHAPDVFRFALYLSGDRVEAEEITAETFARAFAASDRIRTETVKGYLFTIARHLFLKARASRSRAVELLETEPDPAPGPDESAETASELRVTLAALQTLPESDRAALLMRAADETPYEEIARSLGISVGSAKVKVHRARLALARMRNGWRRTPESRE